MTISTAFLSPWVRARRLGRILPPQTGVYLNDINYVDPDLLYLRRSQIPRRGQRSTTAAVAVEILSLRAPRVQREAMFLKAGVEEVWYIDHEQETLEIRRLREGGYETTALFAVRTRSLRSSFPGWSFP